jgi:hypothetical protein
MPLNDDWRLMGQERYLQGVKLEWKEWHQTRDNWDHDHCEFCFAKFMDYDSPDILHWGYTDSEEYRWVCKTCFEDFKEMFEWKLVESFE